TKVLLDGEDVTSRVISEFARPTESMTMQNIKAMDWNPDFIEALGAIPCPYHRYYYQSKVMLEEELEAAKKDGTRAEVVKKLEDDLFELY
ncbi:6-phospho-beta-glucosidase, partial [Pseudomonas sp. FW305-BF6]